MHLVGYLYEGRKDSYLLACQFWSLSPKQTQFSKCFVTKTLRHRTISNIPLKHIAVHHPYDILTVSKIIFLCILITLIKYQTQCQFLKNSSPWSELPSPLKFNGFCLYHQPQPYIDPTFCSHNVVFVCSVQISEQTSIIPLYSLTYSFLQLRQNMFTALYELNL